MSADDPIVTAIAALTVDDAWPGIADALEMAARDRWHRPEPWQVGRFQWHWHVEDAWADHDVWPDGVRAWGWAFTKDRAQRASWRAEIEIIAWDLHHARRAAGS